MRGGRLARRSCATHTTRDHEQFLPSALLLPPRTISCGGRPVCHCTCTADATAAHCPPMPMRPSQHTWPAELRCGWPAGVLMRPLQDLGTLRYNAWNLLRYSADATACALNTPQTAKPAHSARLFESTHSTVVLFGRWVLRVHRGHQAGGSDDTSRCGKAALPGVKQVGAVRPRLV